jgi:hypothetical protein
MIDGRNVYRRYDWADVDCVDVDMVESGGRHRGFGVHKSPALLRQPGEWKKIDGLIDE